MSETMRTIHFTRRTLLRGLALLGVSGAMLPLVGAPRLAGGRAAPPRPRAISPTSFPRSPWTPRSGGSSAAAPSRTAPR